MTWLEENKRYLNKLYEKYGLLQEANIAKFNSDYYRVVLNDVEHILSDKDKLGFFTGCGKISDNIEDWITDEKKAWDLKCEINYRLDTLQQWMTIPQINKKDYSRIEFAYKKDKFIEDFKIINQIDNLIKSLDMGFSLEYEEVYPDKIVYEDKDQIAYISEEKR